MNCKFLNQARPFGRSPRPGNLRGGFTLVELLVVITIVVVLAALVFTLTGTARRAASKAKELSNIRNISHIIIQYQTDKNVLPGPVNRGIMIPSKVADASRGNWLSTRLIDEGFLGESDDLWKTSLTEGGESAAISYVLNSTINSVPTYFFGAIAAPGGQPKSLTVLRANIKDSLGGRQNLDLGQIWIMATADYENYGASPLIRQPLADGTASEWGGRFYSFFDGHVEFVRRQSPSIYPSSFSGNHK